VPDQQDADAATMAAIASGDERALRDLYDRYGRIVYSVSYRVTNDAHLAEECTQDVFLRVWRRARDFDPSRAKTSTWLFAIARNRAIESWRSRARHRSRLDVRPDEETQRVESLVDEGARDPAELVAAADEALRVAEALAALPPEQFETLQLAYFEGLSHAEIAERLRLPLGTVKGRVRLALDRLRHLAEEHQLGVKST
jgi:RNA polymerase sigma-70 factor, ECF subfamily